MHRFSWLLFLILAVGLTLLCPTWSPPLYAQTAQTTNPWYSADNLTVCAGAGYQWWGRTQDAQTISPRKEFIVGLYSAWTLSTHLDATLTVEYGVDSKQVPLKAGLRYVLKAPK